MGAWSTAADCDSLVSFLADRYLNVPSDSEIIQQARDKLLPTSDVYCIGALDNYCSRDISVAIQLSRIFIYPFKSCAGKFTCWHLAFSSIPQLLYDFLS